MALLCDGYSLLTSMKQEISNNVTLTASKDLEEAVKDMYRKYVRNESSRLGSRTVRPYMTTCFQL